MQLAFFAFVFSLVEIAFFSFCSLLCYKFSARRLFYRLFPLTIIRQWHFFIFLLFLHCTWFPPVLKVTVF